VFACIRWNARDRRIFDWTQRVIVRRRTRQFAAALLQLRFGGGFGGWTYAGVTSSTVATEIIIATLKAEKFKAVGPAHQKCKYELGLNPPRMLAG